MSAELLTRRHLPHWFVPAAAHFITYRLAGTIPVHVFQQFQAEHEARLRQLPAGGAGGAEQRQRLSKEVFAKYDRYLDNARDIRWLAQPPIAALVRGNLYHHDHSKYSLLAYCIMPNHVHVLLQPRGEAGGPAAARSQDAEAGMERPDAASPLAHIMHSLKSYTAHEANKTLQRSGTFWQAESYDHWVRDEDELERIVEYIRFNPVKAGLVRLPHEWFFSSAHDRFLADGSECGWLQLPEE